MLGSSPISSAAISALLRAEILAGGIASAEAFGSPRLDSTIYPRSIFRNIYASEVLVDAPVAYWRLGEPSGTTAVDASGNGFDGTYLASVTGLDEDGLLEDDVDTAVLFPGGIGTTHCMLRTVSPVKTTGAVTVEAWIKPNSVANDAGVCRSGQGTDLQYGLFVTSTGALRYHWYDGTFRAINSAAGEIVAGQRYHIALVRAANGVDVQLFKNGVAVHTETAISSCTANSTQSITVGGVTGTSSQNFDGVVDEAAIYDYALSPERIAVHHQVGVSGDAFGIPTTQGHITIGRGYALEFNAGSAQMVTVDHDASLDITGDWTLEAWVKPLAAHTNVAGIVSRIHPPNVPYVLSFNGSNTIKAGFFDGAWHQVLSTFGLLVGTLYHIVGIHRGATLELYINGVLNNSTGGHPTATPTSTTGLRIGRRWDLADYVTGVIDGVRVYSRALSAIEVADHHLGRLGDESGLVGKWMFNEGTGIVANDTSGNGNNGTLVNGPLWVDPLDPLDPVGSEGIATDEAFGAPQLNGNVKPAGIASAEVFGLPQLNLTLYVVPIASAEAFGTPMIVGHIAVPGIASVEAFGILERLVDWSAVPHGGAILVEFEDRSVLVVMDRNPGIVSEPERVVRIAAESRRVVVPAE